MKTDNKHIPFKLPCSSGKIPYWSLHEANQEAKKINQKNMRMSSVPVEGYRCVKCNLWHTGRNRNLGFGVKI